MSLADQTCLHVLAGPEGLKPPTCWFEANRSIQLSYGPCLAEKQGFEAWRDLQPLWFSKPARDRSSPVFGLNGGTRTRIFPAHNRGLCL